MVPTDADLSRALYAIGIRRYQASEFADRGDAAEMAERIERSVREVTDVLQTGGYRYVAKGRPGAVWDLDRNQLADVLGQAPESGDIVVVYYTGHGYVDRNGRHFLCTNEFDFSERRTGFETADLPEELVRYNGRNPAENQPPTLVILDCCFAGKGGEQFQRELFLSKRPLHPNLWIWATAGDEEAVSGTFAKVFNDVLGSPQRFGSTQPFIGPQQLVNELNRELRVLNANQTVHPYGNVLPEEPAFFPNPLWVQGPVPRIVAATTHWKDKAAGGAITGWYLTGRTGRAKATRELAQWISDEEAGDLAIVTGSPGTGKSALLALPVLLDDDSVRELMLRGSHSIDRLAEGSLAHIAQTYLEDSEALLVAVHARGLSADKAAETIAKSLGLTATTVRELTTELDKPRRVQSVVIMVDALDEARGPVKLRDDLLLPLAQRNGLRVVVGSRDHIVREISGKANLYVDLDTQDYHDPEGLIEYISQLLVARYEPALQPKPPYLELGERHDDTVAVARAIAERATSNSGVDSFLIAQVIAREVRGRELIDVHQPNWEARVPNDLTNAFDREFKRLRRREKVVQLLLEALAWAKGPGLPWEDIWLRVACALRELHPEPEYQVDLTDDDIEWLLGRTDIPNPISAYIVEDIGPGNRSVFRPFHDRLADHLRAILTDAEGTDASAQAHRAEAAVAGALLDTLGPSGDRHWDSAHPYLRTYLCEHALAAGPDVFAVLLGHSGFLATTEPSALTPLLSQAAPERNAIVRSYLRARSLLGNVPNENAVYLQEAVLAVTGTPISFMGTGIAPIYDTKWTTVRADKRQQILTANIGMVQSVAFGIGTGGRPLLAVGVVYAPGHIRPEGTVTVWDPATGDLVTST